MLLLFHAFPEREGGGGAPLVCEGAGVRCTREREPETDPQGHCRAGLWGGGVPRRGTPK